MSADNYCLIRRDGEKYVVSMGFASDSHDPPIDPTDRRFDSHEEAEAFADNEYTEYGVHDDTYHGIEQMPALLDEIARLREIVAKYRQTADGVFFNGESTLYCPKGHKAVGPLWDGTYCGGVGCWQDHDVSGKMVGGSAKWYDASELYSTEAAAISAAVDGKDTK